MSFSPSSAANISFPLGAFAGAPGPGARRHRYLDTEAEASGAGASRSGGAVERGFPLIAFCHLSWDWVWQRPQQFLSRLARRHPLLFVETHRMDIPRGEVRVRSVAGHPNITLLRVHLPSSRWHDGAFIDQERRRLLLEALAGPLRGGFEQPVLWFNDPMAVTAHAGWLGERAIVYDCMDELSQFKDPPAGLLDRERALLTFADVVFCGGRKMRDKRLPLNPNCHFYGTGVDCRHFGAALSDRLSIDPGVAACRGADGKGTVLGYFGVIDERLDYDLLALLADARADWQLVMVGPVCKVDPAALPRRSNLHWLGGQPYEQLPAITKGFTVCMMPFALNAATEYINPTKALEYMAAGRPVVSTALDEVRTNFGGVARIARSREEFLALCVRESVAPSQRRIERGLALASENTWEAITEKMERHVLEVLAAKSGRGVSRSRTPGTPGDNGRLQKSGSTLNLSPATSCV
jgi:glycosyltransferase involved in cell wall biosynthesis